MVGKTDENRGKSVLALKHYTKTIVKKLLDLSLTCEPVEGRDYVLLLVVSLINVSQTYFE